jgi:hypothetical protein
MHPNGVNFLNPLPFQLMPTSSLPAIRLSEVQLKERKLVFRLPRNFNVFQDPESNLYTVKDKELGINVYSERQDNLEAELSEQLVFLWDNYALEEPEKLTKAARKLKTTLLKYLKEVK